MTNTTNKTVREAMSDVMAAIASVHSCMDDERAGETGRLLRSVIELRGLRFGRISKDLQSKAEQLIDQAMHVYHRYTDGTEAHEN